MNNFILGTAQLGMPYGIANTQGQPDLELSQEIVSCAVEKKINYFDTAQVYGTSENVLGQCLQSFNTQDSAKIITKVASENLQDKVLLEHAFGISLQNLGINSIYCFMLHHEEYLPYLDAWQGEFLRKLQEQEKIKKIGISVYAPQKALQALDQPLIQVVQVPSSLFDKRFITTGVFEKAKELKKEIHIRSVFLQGVLCMPPENLPIYLHELQSPIFEFQNLCKQYQCTPAQAALFWMQSKEPEALLIFGAESIKQVAENTDATWLKNCNMQEFLAKLDEIYVPQEPKLLNPALWNK